MGLNGNGRGQDYEKMAQEFIRAIKSGRDTGQGAESFGPYAPVIDSVRGAFQEGGVPGAESALSSIVQAWPQLASVAEGPRLFRLADMWAYEKEVRPFWGSWVVMSSVTLIGGISGVGKSTFILAMVAGYLKGIWPDGTKVPPDLAGGNVMYATPEGFGSQTRHLKAWGVPQADLDRVYVPAIPTPGAPDVPMFMFKLDSPMGKPTIEEYCEIVRPRLFVVDGLRAAMTGDESKSDAIDSFMGWLIGLAVKYDMAIILTHHLQKGRLSASNSGEKPNMDWFRGSGHLTSLPRSAWVIDMPDESNLLDRRITSVKAAIGAPGQTMAYRMQSPAAGIQMLDEVPQTPPQAQKKRSQAEGWIIEYLEESGPSSYEDMEAAAEEMEFSKSTLKIARVALSNANKIKSEKVRVETGESVTWKTLWSLVEAPPEKGAGRGGRDDDDLDKFVEQILMDF